MLEDVGGVHTLKVNGVQLNLKGDPTVVLGGETSTLIMGKDGNPHGYVKSVGKGTITVTITDTSSLDLIDLGKMRNGTVELTKPNGKKVILNAACCSGELSYNGAEGEVSVTFEGKPGKELMP